MADGAGFRVEAARAGAKVSAMARSMSRRQLAMIGAGLALLALAFWGGQWLTVGRYQVATDNAYVRADTSLISAKIEGYVRAVPAVENSVVHAGDIAVVAGIEDISRLIARHYPARPGDRNELPDRPAVL